MEQSVNVTFKQGGRRQRTGRKEGGVNDLQLLVLLTHSDHPIQNEYRNWTDDVAPELGRL